jgi:hypothetical protein
MGYLGLFGKLRRGISGQGGGGKARERGGLLSNQGRHCERSGAIQGT